MEARITRLAPLLLLALLLLTRLPFLNQAVQGDDHIYLTEAAHARVDPAHPSDVKYLFGGVEVDLRGHSHPPLNAWVLAGLLAVRGDVKEVPFHAAYIVFPLIALAAMWSLSRRFSPRPFWACALFLVVPAVVVNGGSFEADLPFLAFWMAAIALFLSGRMLPAALAMALATMTAYQGVVLTPVLGAYVWLNHRRDARRWLVLLVPPATLILWQFFMRWTTGAMPAAVLGGYFSSYGLQEIAKKLSSGLMLFLHSWWIVFPVLVPGAALAAWRKRKEPDTAFLLAWIAIFFAAALVIFFAGSARYLLPMAAPVVLLASRLPVRWVAPCWAAQLLLALSLATVNYQHWDACRDFARTAVRLADGHRLWVDGEFALRHYLEDAGARPLPRGQALRAGDVVVSSALESASAPPAPAAVLARREIRPALPFRLIGIDSHSGYSTVAEGFWPFGIEGGVIDRLQVSQVIERQATLSYLPMNAPEAAGQIVSGVYDLEDKRFRWMSGHATLLLKRPAAAAPLSLEFAIPEASPARRVTLTLDGREAVSRTYSAPGTYSLLSAPLTAAGATATLEITTDRSFHAPGDSRELGIVITGAGFH
jgi:hypothetical protein